MYKILNDYTAPDLKESFRKVNEYQNTYNLRDNDTNLVLPKPKSEFLRRSFKYNGAMLRNNLIHEAKQAESYSLYRADYM